ncbi:MAG TPA: ketol-acid reductoisomerase [Patescibacteria group bacterium]|nr:ketol-acid reductoisomerase [Patescibacteria group bacterium]
MADNVFNSQVFAENLRQIELAGEQETVLYGGDRPFDQVAEALADVGQIGVIGFSSQAPAQAQNLRESLRSAGADTQVVVGLRPGSKSREGAEKAGFDLESGTLMTVDKALESSDMSLMLIADAAMAEHGHDLVSKMPKDATLGLSHGFWLGHLEARGEEPRGDISIVGVCPKGMGPSVRRLYTQKSGINSSYALAQGDDAARERALGWSVGIGSPYTFQTTLENEWRSDIFGERAILLGGVHGIVEALYAWKLQQRVEPEAAYEQVVESLVGPISKTISHKGLNGLFEGLDDGQQETFADAYNAAYAVLKNLISKIYTDVSSGREISEVVSDEEHGTPMTQVDGTDMWRVGERMRQSRKGEETEVEIDPTVAGIYVAGMMAQVDVLRENGHQWSEVVNESVIEAVDSLNPFMKARGVAWMVDNCSVTARRGSRKWAPTFQAWISQGILPVLDGKRTAEDQHDHLADFKKHDVHGVLKTLSEMRPDVDIAVS